MVAAASRRDDNATSLAEIINVDDDEDERWQLHDDGGHQADEEEENSRFKKEALEFFFNMLKESSNKDYQGSGEDEDFVDQEEDEASGKSNILDILPPGHYETLMDDEDITLNDRLLKDIHNEQPPRPLPVSGGSKSGGWLSGGALICVSVHISRLMVSFHLT